MTYPYFFIDPKDVDHQLKEFGPNNSILYNTTSLFALKPGKIKIYAAQNSRVFVFDQIDPETNQIVPNKVNIILIPTTTDNSGLTPGVKYFIYRGIDKDSIMNSSGKVIDETTSTTNKWSMATNIFKSFGDQIMLSDLFYTTFDPKQAIDYEKKYQPPLNNILFPHIPEKSRKPVIVKPGECLGCCQTTFGIDIVIDTYHPYYPAVVTGKFALVSNHHLSIYEKFGIPGYDPAGDKIQPGHELPNILCYRESIHSFFDPATYYNLFHNTGIKVVGIEGTVTGKDIYEKAINVFKTRNNIYVDIRNNTGRSLNFYNDCEIDSENNLEVQISGQNTSSVSYYTQYWPILILKSIHFPGKSGSFRLKFPCVNNTYPSIYLDYCHTNVEKLGLRQISNKLISYGSKNEADFFETPNLYFPVHEAESKPSTWFARIYYLRNEKSDNSKLPRLTFQGSPFDNLFGEFIENSAGFLAHKLLSENKLYRRVGISKKYIPSGKWNSKPLMVQTGVAYDKDFVMFEAYELPDSTNIIKPNGSNNKTSTQGNNSSLIEIEKNISNSKPKQLIASATQNIIVHGQKEGELAFRLIMTHDEFTEILNIIKTEFSTHHDFVNFGFDDNSTVKWGVFEKEVHYGKARLNLFGLDINGNFKQVNNIGANSTNFFVTTIDAFTFCSIEYANKISPEKFEIKPRDYGKKAVFTIDEYVNFVKEVEVIFPKGNLQTHREYILEIIARIRKHYYGDYSKVHTSLEKTALELAIPNSPKSAIFGLNNKVLASWTESIDYEMPKQFEPFLSLADENGIEDNPSPYLRDPSGLLIDIGHVLYGLDGLINNYYDTSGEFSHFQIYRSNDFTGYVADVFTAAAESRVYKNKGTAERSKPDFFEKKFHYPETNDIDRLYEISAPIPDLISDVDPFGLYNTFRYFVELNNPLPSNQTGLTLSTLLSIYYDPNLDLSQYKLDNIPVNFQKRWLNFCKRYDCIRPNPITGTADEKIKQFQGFINSNTLQWEADDPEHISVRTLRLRGEIFAHFWYQKTVHKYASGGLLGSNYVDFFTNITPIHVPPGTAKTVSTYLLDKSTADNIVRFERPFDTNPSNQAIVGTLHEYLGNHTDPQEIEYVMTLFLKWVKENYQAENP